MKSILITSALVAALGASAMAQSTTGIDSLKYYVGSWDCFGGPTASPPVHAKSVYTLGDGVLHQSLLIPAQGKMTASYAGGSTVGYDSKKNQFVSAWSDSDGGWQVSVAPPWSGNMESWSDVSTDSGKLGHASFVRTDNDNFAITGYETMSSSEPNFKVACKRSM